MCGYGVRLVPLTMSGRADKITVRIHKLSTVDFPGPLSVVVMTGSGKHNEGIFASKMDTPDTLQQVPDTPCGKAVEYQPHVVHRLCVTLWIEKFF